MIIYFLYGILLVMAVGSSRAGRPCFVADFSSSRDKLLAFQDEFFAMCSTFGYRDLVAVSRACDISVNAVERWKYGLRFPKKERAEDVIAWVRAGKPMIQRRPFPVSPGMV